MFKLIDEFNFKDLELYGFKTFYGLKQEDGLIATRDIKIQNSFSYYRIGIYESKKIFHKSKYRGVGKCLLSLNVKKEDVQDLIDLGIVKRVKTK